MSKEVELVTNLLDCLNESKIRYCHWKSNIDLDKSLSAEGDLDLLIDRQDAALFYQILLRLNFKRANSSWARQFPGMEDYFGWDESSDAMVHLHIHYQLVVGEVYLKSLHLPLEQTVLSNTKNIGKVKVPSCECELLLFIFRHILKIRIYDLVICRKPAKITTEDLDYLLAESDSDRLSQLLLSYQIPQLLFDNMKAAIRSRSPWIIFWRKQQLQTATSRFRRFGFFYRVFRPLFARLLLRIQILQKTNSGKTPVTGGMLISVVGCDGAGKSTLVTELSTWLGKIYPVEKYHLGKPKQSFISYFVLRIADRTTNFLRSSKGRWQRYLYQLGMLVKQFFLARDRFRLSLDIRKTVGLSGIAITDRYPLAGLTLMESMNGIADSEHSNSWLWGALIRKAARYYKLLPEPNLLLVLKVDKATVLARRPDENQDTIESRIEEINQIEMNANVIGIDGNKDQAVVIISAKRAIWQRL